MSDTKHITTKANVTSDGDEQGLIEAVFSTFGNVDSQGDVVLKSAFTDGQEVPMVWSHNWDMPIGKGVVRVTPKAAVFKGQLWLDTEDGLQAFRKIRNSGNLQEFSWGFQVTAAEPGVVDGQDVRFIKAAEVFEVSPVLVGANRQTHVLSIKAGETLTVVADDPDPEPESETVPAVKAEDEPPPVPLIDRAEFTGEAAWLLAQAAKAEPLADDETRDALKTAISRLEQAQRELTSALKRTDPIAQVEPRNQYRRFLQLTAQQGLSTAP